MATATQIFICYRRSDTAAHAGRLYDALCADFGKDTIFLDIGGIEPGDDFANAIGARLASCAVLIAVIGKQWQAARLAEEDDFVRREIGGALARGIRVIPLLVNDATLPAADDLPTDVRAFVRRQMFEMTDRHWHDDYQQLAKSIRQELARHTKILGASPKRTMIGAASLLVMLAAVYLVSRDTRQTDTPVTVTRTAVTSADADRAVAYPTNQPKGVDISLLKGVDWSNPAFQDLSFVLVWASDENFPPLWREARKHHFIRVAEWAFDDHPLDAQANEFLKIAKPTREDLLVVGVYMDNDRSDPQLRSDLHRFLQKIESATGKKPFLFTTAKYWNEHMDDSFGTHPLLLQRMAGVPVVIPRGWSRVSLWLEVKSLPGMDDAFTFTFDGTIEELRALANPNRPRGQ
jgi:GH25 family lysozyme M1 (1,4-beta-N-acetylmuramidase)